MNHCDILRTLIDPLLTTIRRGGAWVLTSAHGDILGRKIVQCWLYNDRRILAQRHERSLLTYHSSCLQFGYPPHTKGLCPRWLRTCARARSSRGKDLRHQSSALSTCGTQHWNCLLPSFSTSFSHWVRTDFPFRVFGSTSPLTYQSSLLKASKIEQSFSQRS
jgi:hypothetical protein